MDLIAEGFRFELGLAAAAGVALGLLLLALRPVDRPAIRHALILLFVCIVAEIGGNLASSRAMGRVAGIAHLFASFGIGAALIRVGALALFHVLLPLVRVRVVSLVEDLATTALLLVWSFVWLGFIGVDVGSLVTTSAVITGVIAFSMQDTLGNILGGIVLQLDESLQVGDWVQIDDVRGRVTDVRWRYTAIETRSRETVFIPNSYLIKSRFTVLGSRADPELRWRRSVSFALETGAAPSRVCAVLEHALLDADIEGVVRDPLPSAVLQDIADGVARYGLRFWVNDARQDELTDSRVRMHAFAALERAGIRPAVRREERLVHAEDDASRAAAAAEDFARRRQALEHVALFAHLSDAEKDELARRLVPSPFVRGDVVTRQGAVAHWLYMVISGEAEVFDESDGHRTPVAILRAGDVFGERGMLTGEPRSATLVATTDIECYRLDKAAFEGVIRQRPDIAEQMSRILEQRTRELDAMRAAKGVAVTTPDRGALLDRIRNFFGLR